MKCTDVRVPHPSPGGALFCIHVRVSAAAHPHLMDDLYLDTLTVYQWVIGQTIAFHLTWPDHPRYTVEQGDGMVTLTAATGQQRTYATGQLEGDALIADARSFILAHADVRGLQRGKHSTWKGPRVVQAAQVIRAHISRTLASDTPG